MTREEAIYCMKSYIDDPNYEHCTSCPYYGANQIGENVFVCNSGEAHKMAVEALKHELCEDAINRVLKRMWNCRGKHTTSIDKVKMEQIIRDELSSVNPKADVLDKIREEIKSKKFGLADTEDGRRIQSDIHAGFNGGIECALQIIDKYKAGPTGEEVEK